MPSTGKLARHRVPATHGMLRRLMWELSRLRSRQSLKAPDVAREFEVSVRTVYRDLDFLRDDWRVPFEFDRAEGSYRLTEPTTVLPPVALSRGELVAMFFAEKVLRQYRGTPFEPDLLSAFRKIQELLPEEVSVVPETLDSFLSLDMGPTYTPEAAVFAEILSALRLRRTALIRYRSLSSGRTTNRRVRPYHVFNHRGDWYVAAWDERRGDVRDFALHRIRRVTLTTQSYAIAKDFDFRKYAADAFAIEKGDRPVEIAVRFAPRQARWIRDRKWHRSARIQLQLDGGCVLRLSVAGLGEVKRWVMQFGPEAEVLEPKRLREEVAEALAGASALYRLRRAGLAMPRARVRRRDTPDRELE